MIKASNFVSHMHDPDVTAFIQAQPPTLQQVLNFLRACILEAGLHIEETIKYHIPFYSYYGRLCFLNPRGDTIELGLCQGAFLSNGQGLLEGAGKEVRHIRIKSLADIDQTALQALLQEAMWFNEEKKKQRKR